MGSWDKVRVIGPNHVGNAKRIVACINALAGLNPDAIPDVVRALEHTADWPCEREPICTRKDEPCRSCEARQALAKLRGGVERG